MSYFFLNFHSPANNCWYFQMQVTDKVTMWPVGLVTDLGVSSPIVKNGRVVGFYDGWNGRRKFPVDMAGFAINLQLFLDVSYKTKVLSTCYGIPGIRRQLTLSAKSNKIEDCCIILWTLNSRIIVLKQGVLYVTTYAAYSAPWLK